MQFQYRIWTQLHRGNDGYKTVQPNLAVWFSGNKLPQSLLITRSCHAVSLPVWLDVTTCPKIIVSAMRNQSPMKKD